MKIKISTFKSLLKHSSNFIEENKIFIENIEQKLNTKFEFAPLNDYDCDLKLIFIQTGGSEGLFLENLKELKEPYYLLTSGGNNSLAASLEIMTYLNLNNKKGEILHGSAEYLAKRIEILAKVNKVKEKLRTAKLGVLGKPSDWLIASTPNFALLKEKLGIELKEIPLSVVEDKVEKINNIENTYQTDFNKLEIKGALKIYQALKEITKENNLNGLTIRCFDLLTSIKKTGCLALSKLNDEGIIGTCEGDIMAMVSMLLLTLLTDKPTFQANPSRIDVENNEIIFAHCTIPLKLVTTFKFDTHFESGIGVAIKGELRKSKVTIFRVSADLSNYSLTTGNIISNLNEKNLCRTQIKVHLDSDVTNYFTNACGNHHIICYGDQKELIQNLMKELNFN